MSLIELNKPRQPKSKLRLAVIGAGMMGQHHLRIYSLLSDVELVAVVDIDEKRAAHAAQQYQCQAYTAVEDILGKVDAVSIAVPSSLHAAIGLFCLENHIHCLIEKPLAVTEAECLALIQAAEKKGLILLVGHIEHFNPAVQQLMKILSQGVIIHGVHVQRMSGSSKRIADVDVVMDLMIHDVDIVSSLIRQTVLEISAQGTSEARESGWDYVSALMRFAGGAVANLTASRITQSKVRNLSLTTDLGYITLDYHAQELRLYKQPKTAHKGTVDYLAEYAAERVMVRQQEPLMAEIQNFLHSIRSNTPLGVEGKQALAALKLVWQIQDKLQTQIFTKDLRLGNSLLEKI